MRKVSLIVLLFVTGFGYGQIVNIPDPVFKNALVNMPVVDTDGNGSGDSDADTNDDSEIQVIEAEAVIGLYVGINIINSLTGIEAFVNLEVFQCQGNLFTSLETSTMLNLR